MTFYLTVSAETEIRALATLVDNAKSCLDASSIAAFEYGKRTLIAMAKPPTGRWLDQDPNVFRFGLKTPLRTAVSQEYKGDRNDAAALYAEVGFEWKIRRVAAEEGRFEVHGGGVNVEYLQPDGQGLKKFHYDICRGGVDEHGGAAHHPFAHFQYGQAFSDLPRLPSLIFTPTDILEQVLLDLWPKSWPATSQKLGVKAALHRHYHGQKSRLEASATCFVASAKAARLPLRGIQDKLVANLVL